MIERLIEWSAKNPLIVFLLVAALTVGGLASARSIPLDAVPDLSDTQVIVFTRWMGRSPDLVEDQVTYPIVAALLSAPRVRVVRGLSDFGHSYVYAIFEEGTDIYWARSRVLEYLSQLSGRLPEGVSPSLGPDATGVGWVYMYALVDDTGKQDLQSLRSFQEWYLRYQIASVEGVAEVANLGGFVKQYQVHLDPNKLRALNIPIQEVVAAIRMSNQDVGARLVEVAGTEQVIRGLGYVKRVEDVESIVVGMGAKGTPISVRDVGYVTLGSELRRGFADLDGEGEVVGGIVVMRQEENALNLIRRVEEKLEALKPSLPPGVRVVTTYDRSGLIRESIDTATWGIVEELLIVSAMIVFFLLHVRSALIPIIVLPIAVAIAFIPMLGMRLTANVMSLGGIVIAIGDMVDAAIVLVENAHKRLESWAAGDRPERSRFDVLVESMKEVGPPIFTSLLVMAIAFMPVFTLQAQEGRLFKPLAFTKNLSIAISAVLAVTLVPALIPLLVRGKILSEKRHPISRVLIALYTPIVRLVIQWRKTTLALALLATAFTIPAYLGMGSEFMPPLEEGSILYMPTTLPGISATETGQLLQMQDKILRTFPEVERVFGKAGRAETSTDPAPYSMMETTIMLKPKEKWREGMTFQKLVDEMDRAMQFPGVTNAWTMPVKGRVDMLTTGIRTPVGIKIFGPDLPGIEKYGEHLEMVLKEVPGTRSVYAERVAAGYFLDFNVRRDEAARYGLTVGDVQDAIEAAVGGTPITTTVEGRERYPVNVRYFRDYRDDLDALRSVIVPTKMGAHVPLAQLADVEFKLGAPMIRDEDGLLTAYVYVDVQGRDIGSYVDDAKRAVVEKAPLPTGYTIQWSGQYEFMERVRERLKIFVPLTVAIIFLLYFFTFRSIAETLIVMLSVPFALLGAIWFLSALGYNMSIAVWVGLIALAGVAAETGSIMIVYLDEAYGRRVREGTMRTMDDLYEAVVEGSAQRLRPKLMTVLANIFGLMPVMWAAGTGADTMKRISAPLVGGLVSSTILTLFILPAIFTIWKGFEVRRVERSG